MHEVTKRLKSLLRLEIDDIDAVLTTWAKERAEWLEKQWDKKEVFVKSQYKPLIDQAFQIEEESLEEIFIKNHCWREHPKELVKLAKEYFRNHREELDK